MCLLSICASAWRSVHLLPLNIFNIRLFLFHWASLVAKLVKNLSAMQETQVQSLSQEDPLEEEMATHSSTIAWKIPWMEEPGAGHSPWGRKESDIIIT